MPTNFYDGIDAFGSAPAAITEANEWISYAQVAAMADAVASVLRPRSLVLLVCSNTLESLVGYLGCLRARAVPLVVGSSGNDRHAEDLLRAYRPEFLWAPRTTMAAGRGTAVHVLSDYVLTRTSPSGTDRMHDSLALLLTTSGSTGSPALVRLSYANLDSNTRAIVEYLGISSADRPITTLPMSYTYGLSIINSHLLCGCAIVLTSRSVIDKGFWAALRAHEATTFGGVPYTYEMLSKLRFPGMDVPSLRTVTQAGGKLPADRARELAVACREKGIRFIVMYGQAEATARMSWLPAEHAVSKAGSIGMAIPGGKLWLEDESGRVITASGVEGELVYQGENVSLGYAHSREDLAKGDENRGVLRTGDLAERDADGFYYITGRRKRFLKLFGNRVSLDDVERMLAAAGFESACSGVDDHLRVYTTSRERHPDLIRMVAEYTGIHPSAFAVAYVERIPRNESGKVIYPALAG